MTPLAHGTLEKHVAVGEERFVIEWDSTTNDVYFEILAFSQPATFYTKMGYPAARYVQGCFGAQSLQAVYNFVHDKAVLTQSVVIDF